MCDSRSGRCIERSAFRITRVDWLGRYARTVLCKPNDSPSADSDTRPSGSVSRYETVYENPANSGQVVPFFHRANGTMACIGVRGCIVHQRRSVLTRIRARRRSEHGPYRHRSAGVCPCQYRTSHPILLRNRIAETVPEYGYGVLDPTCRPTSERVQDGTISRFGRSFCHSL